ncbi:MAG: hypothetical protein G5663_06925 [Serratia symbiotica]|nr:hypothetical protein [Serratia symbiotica]
MKWHFTPGTAQQNLHSNIAITCVLMLKRIFGLTLRALQGVRHLYFYTDKSAVELPRLYLHQ